MLNIPLNLTLTIAPTLLLSTVFNTVQEFGTAVYWIAQMHAILVSNQVHW